MKGWCFRGYFPALLWNTGNIACNRRFYRNRSSRPEMKLYNVYRGGLNPTSFVGFRPPQYTLYNLIFGRLLLFPKNHSIHTLTRASGAQAEKIRGNTIPSPRWSKSDFFAYRRISNCLFFYIPKKANLDHLGEGMAFPRIFFGFVMECGQYCS